jgi:hypothetical protein
MLSHGSKESLQMAAKWKKTDLYIIFDPEVGLYINSW